MKWVNLIFYILMVGVNAFANIFKLGGKTTGEISGNYANVVTPAPYTFFIWGVIYLLLLVFVIAPFFNPDGKVSDTVLKLKGWFAISCVLNIAWIVMWHFDKIGWSLGVMGILLLSLYIMYTKYSFIYKSEELLKPTWGTAGLSVYLSWICVATVANTMVLLVKLGLDGFDITAQVLSSIMLIIGAITLSIIAASGNWLIAITGIWAYTGILVRQLSPNELNGAYGPIILTLILGIGIMVFGSIVGIMGISGSVKPKKDLLTESY